MIEQYPVSAEYTPTGWESPGIAYEDYARMSTQQHKQSGERRLPTPQWAVNDEMLRTLLLHFMERRAYRGAVAHRKKPTGTPEERMQNAQTTIKAQRPEQIETIGRLCKLYISLPPSDAQRFKLQIQIESLDTYLRYTEKDGGLASVASIVHLYYRAGLDSVGIGQEIGLKPPHVRQTLWRMFETAALLANDNPQFKKSKKEFERACEAFGITQPLDAVMEYRFAKVDVLQANGDLVRIRNAKGEVLTVDRAQLRRL